jgi:hypothetical protein
MIHTNALIQLFFGKTHCQNYVLYIGALSEFFLLNFCVIDICVINISPSTSAKTEMALPFSMYSYVLLHLT